MSDTDELEMQELAKTVQTTKDGRSELGPEELVTEDEKNDDDDDDEFDDDDSSSAVGSPGGSSSVDTPGSSSGVETNQMRVGVNREAAHYGGSNGESRDGNEMQSVKTAVPPMTVGEGLLHSDKASAEKLI